MAPINATGFIVGNIYGRTRKAYINDDRDGLLNQFTDDTSAVVLNRE
jgi:hypothetical protein